MIICHCHRVTDKHILKLVEDGAKTFEDIKCGCNACTGCEGCKKAVLEILKEAGKLPIKTEKNDD